jgi:hypothetical protein
MNNANNITRPIPTASPAITGIAIDDDEEELLSPFDTIGYATTIFYKLNLAFLHYVVRTCFANK